MKNILFILLVLVVILFSCTKEIFFDFLEIGEYEIIEGYTDKNSYEIGDTVHFFLKSNVDTLALIEIKDLNDKIISSNLSHISNQEIINPDPWKNGLGFDTTVSIVLDENNFSSGLYFLETIPIIVKKKKNESTDLLVVLPTNTMTAYTVLGGKSFYKDLVSDGIRADVLSFRRPYRKYSDEKGGERLRVKPGVKWLYNQGYDINFITDYDMDEPNYSINSNIIVIVGHSEFWTRKARLNFDYHVDIGKNALILSGNTMWKQVRYEDNGNRIFSYYNSHPKNDNHPEGLTTGFSGSESTSSYEYLSQFYSTTDYPIYPSIGADWWNGGYGYGNAADTIGFGDEQKGGYKIIDYDSLIFQGTNLKENDILNIPTREYDGCIVSGFDSNNNPIFNSNFFYKTKFYGYDIANLSDNGVNLKHSAFFAFQKQFSSGVIINTSSMDWCYEKGLGSDHKYSSDINTITRNMLNILSNNDASSILFD
jgi:hypothetical protein